MSRNSSGVYTLPAGNPVVTLTTIATAWANTSLQDIANELTNSIDKGGRTAPTANLPMAGFKHTGAAAGATAGEYLTYGQTMPATPFGLGTAATPSVTFTGDLNTGMWSPGADQIGLSTGGANRLTLDAAGRMLLNAAGVTPGVSFTVGGTGEIGAVYGARNTLHLKNNNSASNQSNALAFGSVGTPAGAALINDPDANGTVTSLSIYTGGTEAARVDGSQSVMVARSSSAGSSFKLQTGNGSADTRVLFAASTSFALALQQGLDGAGLRMYLGVNAAGNLSVSNNGGTERFVFAADGRIYGTALHNNASGLAGTATNFIGSGTYTPTYANVGNTTLVAVGGARWMRVGNVVTVSGRVAVSAAATGLAQFSLTLPIASAVGVEDLSGVFAANPAGGASVPAVIAGGSSLAQFVWTAAVTGSHNGHYTFTYEVK